MSYSGGGLRSLAMQGLPHSWVGGKEAGMGKISSASEVQGCGCSPSDLMGLQAGSFLLSTGGWDVLSQARVSHFAGIQQNSAAWMVFGKIIHAAEN